MWKQNKNIYFSFCFLFPSLPFLSLTFLVIILVHFLIYYPCFPCFLCLSCSQFRLTRPILLFARTTQYSAGCTWNPSRYLLYYLCCGFGRKLQQQCGIVWFADCAAKFRSSFAPSYLMDCWCTTVWRVDQKAWTHMLFMWLWRKDN